MNVFRRACQCGHPWSAHQHYRSGTDCATCGCIMYQPRPWWPRKTPAGGEPPANPPTGDGSHLPGRTILPPPATHHGGGVVRLIDIRNCGCCWVWRRGSGWMHITDCHHDEWFDLAEWEGRLTQ